MPLVHRAAEHDDPLGRRHDLGFRCGKRSSSGRISRALAGENTIKARAMAAGQRQSPAVTPEGRSRSAPPAAGSATDGAARRGARKFSRRRRTFGAPCRRPSIAAWQADAVDAAKIVGIGRLALAIDHQPPSAGERHGAAAHLRQVAAPRKFVLLARARAKALAASVGQIDLPGPRAAQSARIVWASGSSSSMEACRRKAEPGQALRVDAAPALGSNPDQGAARCRAGSPTEFSRCWPRPMRR